MSRLIKIVNDINKKEVDFTEFEDADPNLDRDTHKAVENLDFEAAERITRNTQLSRHNDLRDNHNQLLMSLEKQDADIKLEALKLAQNFERQADEKAMDLKHAYQTKFTKLVTQHRREAERMKEKWIENHNRAESVALKKIDDLKHTSKVLASCECYEAAKDLRDRTQLNEEQIVANETEPVDAHFRAQFETMMQRHQEMYDALLQEMNNRMEYVKNDAKVQNEKATVDITYREAMSPVELMKKIAADGSMSIQEKSSMIRTLTPSRLSPLSSRASSQLIASQKIDMNNA